MKVTVLGPTGFVSKNLQNSLKPTYDIWKVSLRKGFCINKDYDSQVWINCVGKAHDFDGKATKEDFYYANFELVKVIYNEFINSNASLLIHISSIAAQEEFSSDIPLMEDAKCNPISLYGKSKREAEIWLMNQKIPANKKIIILRPPMIHGEGDKGNLRNLFNIVRYKIPNPFVSFKNKRSFISIDNFVFYIDQIIQKHNILPSGIYNVCDDEGMSTNKIIEIIKEVKRFKLPNIYIPKFFVLVLAKIGDFVPIPINTNRLNKLTSNLLVSNSKIKNALAIDSLPLSAEEGMIKTIKSF